MPGDLFRSSSRALSLLLVACASTPTPTPTPPPTEPEPAPVAAPWLAAEVEVSSRPASTPSPRGAVVPIGLRGYVHSSRWSPNGDLVAVVTNEKIVALVDAATGEVRAARRLRVRRESSAILRDFDGTRLLVSHSDYEDEGAVIWDVVADSWRELRLAPSDHAAALTPRGVLVRGERTLSQMDDEGRRVALPDDGRPLVVGDHVVVDAGNHTSLSRLPSGDESEVQRIARVPGRLRATRPRGGLFATEVGGAVRVARVTDGNVVFARTFAGFRELGWDHADRFFVDAEQEGVASRHRFDGRTGEPVDVVRLAHVDDEALVVGESILAVAASGALVRTTLGGDDATEWRAAPPDDAEPMYDDVTGEELGRVLLSHSPDASRVLLLDGLDLAVLDASDGHTIAAVPRDDSGATSVWGVETTPGGVVVWGRSHVSHWSEHGARVFECQGRGFFFGDDETPGWSSGYAACVGGQRGTWPAWDADEGYPAWVGGGSNRELFVFSERKLLRVDARSLRARGAVRGLRDLSLECYEEGCEGQVFPFGRSLLLWGSTTGIVEPSGRFHALEGWPSARGGERMVFAGDTPQVMDPRGRVVRELPEIGQVSLEPNGARLARSTDHDVFVERTDDGSELWHFELAGTVRLELHDSALLVVGEEEQHVIHLPTGTTRVRVSRAAHVALDAEGERAAICDEGRLSLHSIIAGRHVADLGTCELADSLAFVAGGRMVAVPSRTQVTLVRTDDRRRLIVHGYRTEAYAEDGEHVLATEGVAEKLRWRGPGAIATAPLGPLAPSRDPELLRRFFAPPVL